MSNLDKILLGLGIFSARGGTDCDAQHDILYAGQGDDIALSADDIQVLYKLGWFHDSESCDGCAEGDGEPGAYHDPDDPGGEERWHNPTCNQWAIFT